jgi:hypothetical protein
MVDLEKYITGWRRVPGKDWGEGPAFMYEIPGPEPGQTVLTKNVAPGYMSHWECFAIDGDRKTGWTGQYETAEDAFDAGRESLKRGAERLEGQRVS